MRLALEGARTVTSDDTQVASGRSGELGRGAVVSTSAHVWGGGGGDEEGSIVLWGKRVTNTVSVMAVFEWPGPVFSSLPFAVAVQIVPSPDAPCAQLVNFVNGERQGRR